MNSKTVRVYDTINKKYVDVEVTPEVYAAYMRTGWNIHDNNESFYKHEIQFSQLIGGNEGTFENFDEFITDLCTTSGRAITVTLVKSTRSCIKMLKEHEVRLLTMIYYDGLTEQECALIIGTTRQNIHNKHRRILAKIHKLLEM